MNSLSQPMPLAMVDLEGVRPANIAHEIVTALGRERPDHDLNVRDLFGVKFRRGLAQLFHCLFRMLRGNIELVSELFAGEAAAIDFHGDAVHGVVQHLEELDLICWLVDDGVKKLQRAGTLNGVHVPLGRNIAVGDVESPPCAKSYHGSTLRV